MIKRIAGGHGPAMLFALLLSLIAGAPAAAVPQSTGTASSLEQAPSQQSIFVKRAHMLQGLRVPQPTPFAAIIPDAPCFADPIAQSALVGVSLQNPSERFNATREPYQPRAPPAA